MSNNPEIDQSNEKNWINRAGGAVLIGTTLAGVLVAGSAHPAGAFEQHPDGTVTVQQNDNPWNIVEQTTHDSSRALIQDVEKFVADNKLSNPSEIHIGDILSIKSIKTEKADNSKPKSDFYELKYGDTIWDAVRGHYGYVTASMIDEIAANSNIDTEKYFPGQVLIFNHPEPVIIHFDQPKTTEAKVYSEANSIDKSTTITISGRSQTLWALSQIIAAVNKTSHESALNSIFRANPGIDPYEIKIGDKVVMPNISEKEIAVVMAETSHLRQLKRSVVKGSAIIPKISQPDPSVVASAESQPANVKTLATEILTDPNISVDNSPHDRVKKYIESVQNTGETFAHDTGNPDSLVPSVRALQILVTLAEKHHISISSFTTGEHAPGSNHYRGEAFDIGIDQSSPEVYRLLYDNHVALGINELIWANPPDGTTTLNNGVDAKYSDSTIQEHKSHIHFSVFSKDALPQPQTEVQKTESPIKSEQTLTGASSDITTNPEAKGAENIALPPYSMDTDVRSSSGMTVEQLDKALEGTKLHGYGYVFVSLEKTYGINALFAAAHAANESSWGSSDIAIAKNNLFGDAAFDNCPMSCAKTFTSYEESIRAYGLHINNDYLNPSGAFYGGSTTIHGIFVHYSTSHDKQASVIAEMMNEMLVKSKS